MALDAYTRREQDSFKKNLEALQNRNDEDHAEVKKLLMSQNGRLKAVEVWKARMEGMGAAFKIIGGWQAGLIAAVTSGVLFFVLWWVMR